MNHRGDPCPPWGELPGTIQRAWSGAAARAGDVAARWLEMEIGLAVAAAPDPLDQPPEGLGDAQIAVWRRYRGAP